MRVKTKPSGKSVKSAPVFPASHGGGACRASVVWATVNRTQSVVQHRLKTWTSGVEEVPGSPIETDFRRLRNSHFAAILSP